MVNGSKTTSTAKESASTQTVKSMRAAGLMTREAVKAL